MIGIIYKFTIVAKYKMDGHKPFYVGQHGRADDFDDYDGSGSIWGDFLNKLKQDYPKHWRKFIKREILYRHECSQKALDKLEEYYIKKEKAYYSYKLGGCNILWGTANKFGSGSPMKDKRVVMKRYKTVIANGSYKGEKNPFYGRHHTEEAKKKIRDKTIERFSDPKNRIGHKFTDEQKRRMSEAQKGEKSWMFGRKGKLCHNFGRKLSKETRKKISEKLSGKNNPNYGKRWSDEVRYKISLHHADFSGDKNPMFGKRGVDSPMYNRKWINNGKQEKFVNLRDNELPQGYSLGRLKHKII